VLKRLKLEHKHPTHGLVDYMAPITEPANWLPPDVDWLSLKLTLVYSRTWLCSAWSPCKYLFGIIIIIFLSTAV